MIAYYILKDDDIINAGDEWIITNNKSWYRIQDNSVCVGYTPKTWDQQAYCEAGWQVRRKITKTKLGNTI